ncbi:MAG: hypothetical protein HRU19_27435 [Pseudobacteriovorax sp.]|nr:hypothetical protein [Pseudobacteriovorax sp.]
MNLSKLSKLMSMTLLLVTVSEVGYSKTRRCAGYYEFLSQTAPQKTMRIGNFLASGSAVLARRARKEARKRLSKCMVTHWERRGEFRFGAPIECTSERKVYQYQVNDLISFLRERICSESEHLNVVTGVLYAGGSGGKKCGLRKELDPNFTVYCN